MGNFNDWEFDKTEEKKTELLDVVFVLIALLTGLFSMFTTYKGFSNNFDIVLSIVIAVIVGLGLFAINITIRKFRINGDSISSALFIFLIFFIVSFISNTNAMYTYFVQKNITKKTQEKTWKIFDYNINILEKVIQNSADSQKVQSDYKRYKQQIEILKVNLYNQITDPRSPGLGEKALIHLKEIESLLDNKITRQKPPKENSNIEAYKRYASNINNQIDELFHVKYGNLKKDSLELLHDEIKVVYDKFNSINNSSSNIKNYSSEITDNMIREFNSLKNKFVKYNIPIKEEFKEFNAKEDDIGSFVDTWYNISNNTDTFATFFAIFLSIMLDIMTPLLAMLYKEEERY